MPVLVHTWSRNRPLYLFYNSLHSILIKMAQKSFSSLLHMHFSNLYSSDIGIWMLTWSKYSSEVLILRKSKSSSEVRNCYRASYAAAFSSKRAFLASWIRRRSTDITTLFGSFSCVVLDGLITAFGDVGRLDLGPGERTRF